MVTLEQMRALCLSFEGVSESCNYEGQVSFGVEVKGKVKGIAWMWRERVDPKKKKEINPGVFAIPTADLNVKEMLLTSDMGAGKVFTEPHYNGYPAVLVRLSLITEPELKDILTEAYASRFKSSPKPRKAN